nr:anion permease [Paracoccaceae bacterium]
IERDEARLPALGFRVLAEGDVLLIRAPTDMLEQILSEYRLEVVSERRDRDLALDRDVEWQDATLLEAVVSPGSSLVGRNARLVDRVFGRNVTLLALSRSGAPITGRLREQIYQPGDVALLQGERAALSEIIERFQLLPLAERGLDLGNAHNPWPALAIFAAAITLGVSGMAPIAVAFILAVIAFVALGILPLRDLYSDVDWPVIVMLGAMFPLGEALAHTGTTSLFAESLNSATAAVGFAPWGVLTVVLVATMFLSDIINNAATAVLMAPLSAEIANSLDVNQDAFLMAVAVGASCAFLTPIGHQCNTLVMGPGGYKFGDYWRMGLPLEAVIVTVSVPAILWAWPL